MVEAAAVAVAADAREANELTERLRKLRAHLYSRTPNRWLPEDVDADETLADAIRYVQK